MKGQKKKRILMVGGDQRDLYLLKGLANSEDRVSAFAIPKALLPTGIVYCKKLEKGLSLADVVILPMPGISNDGRLYAPLVTEPVYITEEQWQMVKENTIVLVGVACQKLKEIAQENQWHLVETAELDEIAIPNAIPTAEGAIKIAIENTPFTIDGADVIVLGYGRVGEVLAKKLKALNSNITVLNRGEKRRIAAQEEGFTIGNWDDLPEVLCHGDIIYNTVPSMVLTEDILTNIKPSALIIDLASKPGGTDFAAAEKQGISAMLAPGLPGKVAPQFAGELLAKVYPDIIMQAQKEKEIFSRTTEMILEKKETAEKKTKKKRKSDGQKDGEKKDAVDTLPEKENIKDKTTSKGKKSKKKAEEKGKEEGEASITKQHKIRMREKSVATATMKINGKVKKAQKAVQFYEQSGEELKKTANKEKKQQRTTVKN